MKKNNSTSSAFASSRAHPPASPRNQRAASAGDAKPLSANEPTEKSVAAGPDLPQQPPLSSVTTVTAAPASPSADVDNLENESKDFLIQRVRALERQLKIRNSDCARLLEDRTQLAILKQKCESKREMILALREQLGLAQAQRESAEEAMEAMKRQQRDKEHRERVANAKRTICSTNAFPRARVSGTDRHQGFISSGGNAAPKAAPASAARSHHTPCPPGGTVVNTASGPQIIYDSSDISSVGFTKNAKLPYDFLGGPEAQLQYLARYPEIADAEAEEELGCGHDASEEAQVRRTMEVAAEAVNLDAKYAEMEEKEHRALMARVKALREGRK
ncbi:hypothetical protein LSCM1_02602 [Leishmania martiniquensis]|uniref:Uncharacterized protein n=1 Tax=Leishmania martiniquensis TaxID=1580590 RepID=A0A836KFZ9_9TRYP|nr:hypothetical protein LSCM1_02602 [Leishmania martiniquensis]